MSAPVAIIGLGLMGEVYAQRLIDAKIPVSGFDIDPARGARLAEIGGKPALSIAELATANIFIGKDGVVFTPAPNGTFLNGITRQRVIKLLRDAGVSVVETVLTYRDVQNADEIFSSGNYSKVIPVNRIEERSLQPGPLYRKARELYWEFAHA